MTFQAIASAAYRALTFPKDGPSLYDVCDPLLLNGAGGDPHLRKFYKTALGNPALRPLLRRAGMAEQTIHRALTRYATRWFGRGTMRRRTGALSASRWRNY